MKTTAKFSIVLLLLLTASFAQEHAPTVQQCQANRLLWWDQFDTPKVISKLPAKKLNERSDEMHDCAVVDEENQHSYLQLAGMFQMEYELRLLDFVTRHHLMAQFMAEDAAGKR